jgi:hypothetical protein
MDDTEFNIPLQVEREFLIKLCLFLGEQVNITNKNKIELDDSVKIYELTKYWVGLILLVENY